MIVTNKEEADIAMGAVVTWLAAAPHQNEQEIRIWCLEILKAARVDDMGGCPLCQS